MLGNSMYSEVWIKEWNRYITLISKFGLKNYVNNMQEMNDFKEYF